MKGSGVRSPSPDTGTTPYPGGSLSPRLLGVPLCIEGCGRPAKRGYRGWCQPCGDTPIEPGPIPAIPDLCVAEGCDEWAVNFEALCVKHRAIEEWERAGRQAGTRLRRGRRFGRLKTVERAEDSILWHGYQQKVVAMPMWVCRCDCGKEKVVWEACLLDGRTRSCGCLSAEASSKRNLRDLKGQRYGSLLVIERAGTRRFPSGQQRPLWRARCLRDGNEVVVLSSDLLSGNTTTCGCSRQKGSKR